MTLVSMKLPEEIPLFKASRSAVAADMSVSCWVRVAFGICRTCAGYKSAARFWFENRDGRQMAMLTSSQECTLGVAWSTFKLPNGIQTDSSTASFFPDLGR